MNIKYHYLIVAAVILMAAGCRTTPSPVLDASPKSLNFTAEGGKKTFTVTSNILWSISGQQTWLTVETEPGKGVVSVTITAEANLSTVIRTCTLKITTADANVRDAEVIITQAAPATVTIAAIDGVTAPVADATPVSEITGTDQYAGTVTWSPTGAFAAGTAYTATITLTPKTGFIFTGVEANFFKVEGATATNDAGSGVIKAAFPAIPDGSKDAPFLVANADDLQKIGKEGNWTSNRHYKQIANITLTGTWTPIGSFSGSYDGGGYSITDLKISAYTGRVGMFGDISAGGELRNLALKNVNIISSVDYPVGAIAGNNNGTIVNCYASGKIEGISLVGGLVGYNYDGVIRNCYTTCDVTGTGGVGGIAGAYYRSNPQSVIAYCYATGTITGTNQAGGIVGSYSNGPVENCVALNVIIKATAGNNVGRVVGYSMNPTTSFSNNYARSDSRLLITNNVAVDLTVPGLTGATTIHGESVAATNMNGSNNGAWWMNTAGFDDDFWSFGNGHWPKLKTTAGEAFNEPQYP